MIKFFRKIRQTFIEKGDLKRYLLYAFGEILIVAIGILFALQINNWNTIRVNRQQELKVYQNVRRQIVEDLNELSEVINFN